MTTVADNLPGYMQYLDLIRDCIAVFSLKPLPPNQVESQHIFGNLWGRDYAYAAEDIQQDRNEPKSTKYDPVAHDLQRQKDKEQRERKKLCVGSRADTIGSSLPESTSASRGTTTVQRGSRLEGRRVANDDSVKSVDGEHEDVDEDDGMD
jgi:hypothetical protein